MLISREGVLRALETFWDFLAAYERRRFFPGVVPSRYNAAVVLADARSTAPGTKYDHIWPQPGSDTLYSRAVDKIRVRLRVLNAAR